MDELESLGMYDAHTEFLMKQKETRMEHINTLCKGRKYIHHPLNINIFMGVVKAVAKKHGIEDKIPTERYPNIYEFLKELNARFQELVPPEDMEWIMKTFNKVDRERVNK